jgi:uncharacterized protein
VGQVTFSDKLFGARTFTRLRPKYAVLRQTTTTVINTPELQMKHIANLLFSLVGFWIGFIAPSHAFATTNDLVSAARKQIGVTVLYDPAYVRIAFPGGDVARERGVCTDVIVRALRDARGFDLQAEINADMRENRAAYPRKWAASMNLADANIDHRRVPNQTKYFERRGFAKPVVAGIAQYQAGDIVAWNLGRGQTHIGIVTDRKSITGTPLVIHNIGRGTLEENILTDYEVIGHFRLPKTLAPRRQ